MTNNVYLLSGIPASGKTTWAKKHAEADWLDHTTSVVISRDAIRKEYGNTGDNYSAYAEQKVFKKFIDSINEAMRDGIENIYVDATHLKASDRYRVISRLLPPENCALHVVYFLTTLRDALELNSKRDGDDRVPEFAMANMFVKFERPTQKEYERGTYMFKSIDVRAAQ